MICIICDTSSEKDVKDTLGCLISKDIDVGGGVFLTKLADLDNALKDSSFRPSAFLVQVSPIWPGNFNQFQDYGGVKLVRSLRRDYHQRAPVIFLGVTGKEYLLQRAATEEVLSLVDSAGTGFVSMPWTAEKIHGELKGLVALTDSELEQVVLENCDLRGHWRSIAHRLGNYLNDLAHRHSEAISIVDLWGRSIIRFEPEYLDVFRYFRSLLDRKIELIDFRELRELLQELDIGLRGIGNRSMTCQPNQVAETVPSAPPKGFSTVLVADDMPQNYLMNSLETDYGYNVLRPQAMKLPTAKKMFDQELPGVVLADMYYKRSDRETEVPDKRVGDEFIKYVLTHPKFRDGESFAPIVLVTSKAELNPDTEIRVGAINCSGARHATDPEYIHRLIWRTANERGVNEPSNRSSANSLTKVDVTKVVCALRQDLDRVAQQWDLLHKSVVKTVEALDRAEPGDFELCLDDFLTRCQPFGEESDFSIGDATALVEQTNLTQQAISQLAETEALGELKDLIHSGIAQYAYLPVSTEAIISKLWSLRQEFSSQISTTVLDLMELQLRGYRSNTPIRPFLSNLLEFLDKTNESLSVTHSPSRVSNMGNDDQISTKEEVDVLIIEDNSFWVDSAREAIATADRLLGMKYQINIRVFQDADSVLEEISTKSIAFRFGKAERSKKRTFAIVDLCIPKSTKSEVSTGDENNSDATPRVKHGMDLLREITSYKYNLPVVVSSSVSEAPHIKQLYDFGVSKDNIVKKDVDSRIVLARKIVQFIERSRKLIVSRIETGSRSDVFRINDVTILFSRELAETFSAIYQHCQLNATRDFTIEDILSLRTMPLGSNPASIIQDHIYRIRKQIFDAFRKNGDSIEVKQLIEIRDRIGSIAYRLNGDVATIDDEADYQEDQILLSKEDRTVLLIGQVPVVETLLRSIFRSIGWQPVQLQSLNESSVLQGNDRLDLIWLFIDENNLSINNISLSSEEAMKAVSLLEAVATAGQVLVITRLPVDEAKMIVRDIGLSIEAIRFIDSREPLWLAKAITYTKHRTRYIDGFFAEPIIEIKTNADLSKGIIHLMVNGNEFKMNRSPLSQAMGLLLSIPNKEISWGELKTRIGRMDEVTENDRKNWTKRLRELIAKKWLRNDVQLDRGLAKRILESSSHGVKLNATVFSIECDPNEKDI